LRLAARHADEPLRARLLARGDELADRAWRDLLRFDNPATARAAAILMIEGVRDSYFRTQPADDSVQARQDYDFGRSERFVPQQLRVLGRIGLLSMLKT